MSFICGLHRDVLRFVLNLWITLEDLRFVLNLSVTHAGKVRYVLHLWITRGRFEICA
jgi:hypothetical protein